MGPMILSALTGHQALGLRSCKGPSLTEWAFRNTSIRYFRCLQSPNSLSPSHVHTYLGLHSVHLSCMNVTHDYAFL
jgi:hypothetical protein